MSRTAPPSGQPPPATARTPAGEVDLAALAREVCRRYDAEFPDERDRYGEAGMAWCEHDNRYLLDWAIADVHHGHVDLLTQVAWLARVLAARDFPLARLARDLEIAADVMSDDQAVAARLLEASASVVA